MSKMNIWIFPIMIISLFKSCLNYYRNYDAEIEINRSILVFINPLIEVSVTSGRMN